MFAFSVRHLYLPSLLLLLLVGEGFAKPLLVEDHSEALCHWYKQGIRGATLVHVDDHDDCYSSLVRIETDPADLRQALERQGCEDLLPRTGFQVRQDSFYSVADFLSPAWQLGVVAEVWWVVAAAKPVDAEWLEDFRRRMGHRYPAEFLEGLRLEGGIVKGQLKGMPVHITGLMQLPAFDKPLLLDIDVDYFIGLYRNPLEREMLSLVGDFFAALYRVPRQFELVTIAASVNGGYTPVRFRYLADWMLAAFDDFDRLRRDGPQRAWRLQAAVEKTDYLLDRKEALRLNVELEKLLPDSGLTAYNRAWMAAGQGRADEALKWQSLAGKRDERYLLGYLELAQKFSSMKRVEEFERLLRAGLRQAPEEVAFTMELGSSLIDRQRYREAQEVFEAGIRANPGVAIPHAGLAFALQHRGQNVEARAAMAEFRRLAQPGQNTAAVYRTWERLLSQP